MTIDWLDFTPWSALAGGALIGLAATLMLVLIGRIAGISGILGGALGFPRGDSAWRWAFVAGLLLSPWVFRLAHPLPPVRIDAGYASLIVAGLLVGYGTRLGSGCTSGHGVCGLSRLSPRSLAATLSFMAAGFVAAYVAHHLLGVGS